MAFRKVLVVPDRRLRRIAAPVSMIDIGTRKLVEDMFETMYAAAGIGLAAIQIGEPWRVVTIDLAGEGESRGPQAFINPEVLWRSDETAAYDEGCLSVPGFHEPVTRPAAIRFCYLDVDGQRREIGASGLLATCLQHEIDHLNGVLFIDHISKLKRDRVIERLTKSAKRENVTSRRA